MARRDSSRSSRDLTPAYRRQASWLTIILPALAYATATGQAPQHRFPNIVILVADDLGYGELGCQGNPQIPTPAIDSIAANGTRLTQGYVTAPNCSPSRAGLLTGRIPTRFGYEFNPIGAGNEQADTGLPSSEITLPEMLKRRGYVTGLIGKWHLGGAAAYHPQRHGWDEFFGFLHEGHYFVPPPWRGVTTWLRRRSLPGGGHGRRQNGSIIYSTHMGHDEPPYDANNPILRAGQPVVESEYLTDAFTREAIDFIDRQHQHPFLLMVTYNAVHSPLQGPAKYMTQFAHIEDIQRRIFAAMLANLDDSVAAVLNQLGAHGLLENTLLIFLSDNGGPTRELTSSNAPLRGGKGTMYEGGLRVPFLLQWPGQIPAGATFDLPAVSVDLLATAEALSRDPRLTEETVDLSKIDGVNLLPFLQQRKAERPHDRFYWRQGARTALRWHDWKLVNMQRSQQAAKWELYDLASDPGEALNLAKVRTDQLEAMIQEWQRWNDQMLEPLF